jgi:hypothetical protein
MHRLTGTFTLVLFSLSGGSAQSFATLESELGVNVSSLPRIGKLAGGNEITLPAASPLIGVWLTTLADKKFNVSLGMQYYSQGQHYKTTRTDYNRLHHSDYQSITVEDMKFHQVSTAILANYWFGLRRGSLGVSMGYRLSHYTAGHYVRQTNTSYSTGVKPDYYYEENLDPFDENLLISAKRSQPQVCLGVQYSFNSRWTASTSYSVGSGLTFTEMYYGWCGTGSTHYYRRGDIGMSVRYRI